MNEDVIEVISDGLSKPPYDWNGVVAGVPDLVRSAEPAVVFASLARRCVPAFSDSCAVDVRDGEARYRVRFPPPETEPRAVLAREEIKTAFESGAHDPGPPFGGILSHAWGRTRPESKDIDAAAARLMVERAVAVITEERLAVAVRDVSDAAANLRVALATNRQIATAIGIVMATYKITNAAAFATLRDLSQRTHRKLSDLADEVVVTGCLPTVSP